MCPESQRRARCSRGVSHLHGGRCWQLERKHGGAERKELRGVRLGVEKDMRWKGHGVRSWTSCPITKVRPVGGWQSDSSLSSSLSCSRKFILFRMYATNRHLYGPSSRSVVMLYCCVAGNSPSFSPIVSGECWTKQMKNVHAIYRSLKGSNI